MMCMRVKWLSIVGVLCICAGLVGCKTAGPRAPVVTQTVTSMQQTRMELVRANQQVDEAVAALDRLASPSAPLTDAYRVYTTQVSETTKQEQEALQRADQMREQWRDYLATWEKELDAISTPKLRARAAERRQTVRENYDRLRDAARAMSNAYDPFVTKLRDIQRTLSLDLTPAGVNATRPAIEATRQNARNLKQQISDFIQEIDQVAAATTGRTPVATSAQRPQ